MLTTSLQANEFDLIAVGRALIANPNWPQLIAASQHEQIRAFDKSMIATLDEHLDTYR